MRTLALVALLFCVSASFASSQSFVNWETPHVSPLDLTPDGSTLLAVNTPDDRLEVFDVVGPKLVHRASIAVGVEPVSVRARGNDEAWVVNHLSDSVSVVDLATNRVIATLATADEPADVVFAGSLGRAFVTCSQVNRVQVFDPSQLAAAPVELTLLGEDPRALAVSPDGSTVYAAIFESGNDTTILGGGGTQAGAFPPNVVSHPSGPYGGQNPPPNQGVAFSPPIQPALPAPPKVGLIVRRNGQDNWIDDNQGDWTSVVSGANAALSGRPVGWLLNDHDVAEVNADTLAIRYVTALMNVNMALAVHPLSGDVIVVGTDATNEIRFEPNVNGTFVRVKAARVQAQTLSVLGDVDLNDHLTYATSTAPQSDRDKSIGDPRGICWNPSGTRGFVTGMGSNNVVAIDATGARAVSGATIEVGAGPTGLRHHPALPYVYVLNRFSASISTIDATIDLEVAETSFFDPTPDAIRAGRPFLYDTHRTSGLGQVSCASCHVDARMDRLAWDLGDPQGTMKDESGQNLGANVPGLNSGFQDWHPMKGPMTTQTLQDIIGKEPHHWRGDRDGIEEFNPAFTNLLGDDAPLTAGEMQAFEDFLATIHFPPNPYRNFDNSLPTNVDLSGHASAGKFSAKGTPLPNGNAQAGLARFRPPFLLDAGGLACSTCHTLPTGLGTNHQLVGGQFQPFPTGPMGEKHLALVSVDPSTNVTMKIPHLRNMHEKVGFDTSAKRNLAGFGFTHDGGVDTLAQFISEPFFVVSNEQMLADLVAFMLAFSGSDLPYGGPFLEPPAVASQDTHAAVGRQTTMADGANPAPGQLALIDSMVALADAGAAGLVVKGTIGGLPRGAVYAGSGQFQTDRASETLTTAQVKLLPTPGSPITWTVVADGSEVRLGVDRDEDGAFDQDEQDAGSDPADALSVPGCGGATAYGDGCGGSLGIVPALSLSGCASANGMVTFAIDHGLGGSNAFLVFGLLPGATPIGGGCNLLVAPLLAPTFGPIPLAAGGPGDGGFSLTTTLPPGTPVGTLTTQALVVDAGSALGLSTTNGLEVTLQ